MTRLHIWKARALSCTRRVVRTAPQVICWVALASASVWLIKTTMVDAFWTPWIERAEAVDEQFPDLAAGWSTWSKSLPRQTHIDLIDGIILILWGIPCILLTLCTLLYTLLQLWLHLLLLLARFPWLIALLTTTSAAGVAWIVWRRTAAFRRRWSHEFRAERRIRRQVVRTELREQGGWNERLADLVLAYEECTPSRIERYFDSLTPLAEMTED